jgi:hypothetical protein
VWHWYLHWLWIRPSRHSLQIDCNVT